MNNQIKFLKNLLSSDDIAKSINDNIENLILIIPEIKSMIGFEHKHPHHHLDVWEHTLLALSFSPNDFDIRLSLLLHDIGKPYSFTEGEVRHFHGHGEVSAKLSKTILSRIGFEKSYIKEICQIIKEHDLPLTENEIIQNLEFSLKKFKVQICDALAHNPEKNAKRIAYINQIQQIFTELDKNLEF